MEPAKRLIRRSVWAMFYSLGNNLPMYVLLGFGALIEWFGADVGSFKLCTFLLGAFFLLSWFLWLKSPEVNRRMNDE